LSKSRGANAEAHRPPPDETSNSTSKATSDVIVRFAEIADEHGLVLGETLEHAVADLNSNSSSSADLLADTLS
jgi:hypothetical protein